MMKNFDIFRGTSLYRFTNIALSVIAVGALAASALFNSCQGAGDTAQQFRYLAHHPVFGDIGIYKNTIERSGAKTTIRTSVHLKVTALGILLHLEDAERIERWKGNRLVYFRGTTTTNGKTVDIKGDALGDSFVITSPVGNVTALAAILPSNPSSPNLFNSDTVMRTDTGEV
jgi:hypothetical protein